MSVITIADAIERYLQAKEETRTLPAACCSDWDCGLANEFSGYYAPGENGDRLEAARKALEKALNDFVDQRIRTVMQENQQDA